MPSATRRRTGREPRARRRRTGSCTRSDRLLVVEREEPVEAEGGDEGRPQRSEPVAVLEPDDCEKGGEDGDEGVDDLKDAGARHAAQAGGGEGQWRGADEGGARYGRGRSRIRIEQLHEERREAIGSNLRQVFACSVWDLNRGLLHKLQSVPARPMRLRGCW